MGKKKVKNKRKAELRIIFFIILVAAVLFIISTYAWFSTQRNVSITNLSGTVEVAEGLEISLDALNWANEIVLSEDVTIINSAYEGHRNVSPVEMLPVSTLGLLSSNKEKDLKMIRGKVTNSIELSEIVAMDEALALDHDQSKHNSEAARYPGYFAFDIFLKNSSKQYDVDDPLQLNYDSALKIIEGGNDTVGLQNTVRVALAKYGTGATTGEKYADNTPIRSGVANVMADQATILKVTGAAATGADDVYLSDVTMWEPNSSDHVEYIVNNNNKITWSSTNATKYNKTLANGKVGFDLTTQIPTFALKESTLVGDVEIPNIYLWDGTQTHLQEQVVLQTTKTSTTDYSIAEGVQNLFSASDKDVPFSIAPNSVIRLRVYVWLEGQDVDCINYASHGGGVTLDLGLVKGSKVGSHETTVQD